MIYHSKMFPHFFFLEICPTIFVIVSKDKSRNYCSLCSDRKKTILTAEIRDDRSAALSLSYTPRKIGTLIAM